MDAIDQYNNRYVTHDVMSFGAAEHVVLNAFPAALYLIFRKRIKKVGLYNSPVTVGAIGSIVSLSLIGISSTAIDRLVLYFSYIQMWIYPALIEALSDHEDVLLFGISAVVLVVFFVYFTLGFTVYAYTDYRNVLFEQ
jgi:hypothetical protein